VIPEALFLKIKDSLYFPSKPNLAFERKSLLKLNINNATIEELEKLPGIGQYTAEKIVNFRDKLGGFHSKEQLLEVYNFKLETYDQVTPLIIVDDQYKKLNINAATYDELNNHPYISKNVANSIIKLRNQKGTFTKLEELLDSKIISEELFFKIKPYLTL
jgi:competence ComEA-like helix-hairpin-helix protein